MKEESQIDWSKPEDIWEAAIPFDRDYTPTRAPMLAYTELVAFARHYMAPRLSGGRRITDVQSFERIRALEERLSLLEEEKTILIAENTVFLARLKKDRRQKDTKVDVDRRK